MNADELLRYYERVADAPDAVARLRRFVLDLAVRGKLVAQDTTDESAATLLTRIARNAVERNGRGSASAATKHDSPTGPPFLLPEGWAAAKLQDILIELQTGPFGSSLHQSDYEAGGTPVINPASIQNERIVPIEKMAVGATALERLRSFQLRAGDIVMARRGEMGRCALVTETEVGWLCGTGSLILRPSDHMYARYLVLLIGTPLVRAYLCGAAVGATMQNLNQGILLNLVFGLPPASEQARIVSKVDELMALCDRLEAARTTRESARDRLAAASLARLNAPDPETFQEDARFALDALPALTTRPDQIKQLRQTILALAVRGKLVAQDSSDELATELVRKIAKERSRITGKVGRAEPPSDTGAFAHEAERYSLPDGWIWARFGELVYSRDGERIPVSKEDRNLRSKIFDYYGASGVIDKIDSFLFDKPLLLIGEDGANLVNRSSPIAFIARGKYWVNNHAHVLDGLSEGLLRFLELFINATDLTPYVTGTAQPKMNQSKMNSIPVALPPAEEQARIVAKVGELMALCDRLEARLASTDIDRQRLLEALLHEALQPAEALEEAA